MEFAESPGAVARLYGLARQLVGGGRGRPLVQECLLKATGPTPSCATSRPRPRCSPGSWSTAPATASAAGAPRESPLPDVEDFSLYRVIAAEDPFPYSDSLHRFGPEDAVGRAARTTGDLPEPAHALLICTT